MSRPKQADLAALIESLTSAGVEFIVVGGAAAVLHGAPTSTKNGRESERELGSEIYSKVRRQRVFGSAKGLIKMADDFDAPLDDFKDYKTSLG